MIAILSFLSFAFGSCTKENQIKHSLVDITWSGTLWIDTVATPYLSYGCPGGKKIEGYKHVVHYNHGLPDSVATTWQEISAHKVEYFKDMTEQLEPYKYVQYSYTYLNPVDTVFKN